MPLRLIPDDTKLPFMSWVKYRTPVSLVLVVLSIVLFFTVGVNVGIDFVGGTVIEVQSHTPVADVAAIRAKVSTLELGDVQIQGIGDPNDVLIRVATQPGGEAAQQGVVDKVKTVILPADYDYRRIEVVGPRVSASWRIPARSPCSSPSPASWPTSGSASNGSSPSARWRRSSTTPS